MTTFGVWNRPIVMSWRHPGIRRCQAADCGMTQPRSVVIEIVLGG